MNTNDIKVIHQVAEENKDSLIPIIANRILKYFNDPYRIDNLTNTKNYYDHDDRLTTIVNRLVNEDYKKWKPIDYGTGAYDKLRYLYMYLIENEMIHYIENKYSKEIERYKDKQNELKKLKSIDIDFQEIIDKGYVPIFDDYKSFVQEAEENGNFGSIEGLLNNIFHFLFLKKADMSLAADVYEKILLVKKEFVDKVRYTDDNVFVLANDDDVIYDNSWFIFDNGYIYKEPYNP